MIELANPLLAGGLLLAAAPLVLHLVGRRQPRPVPWAAMRFLASALARHRRTIVLQHRVLLLLRVLAIACLVLAVSRPRWSGDAGDGQATLMRREHTGVAAVLAIDDSPSAAAEGGIEAMKALARTYLDRLRPGDEVSIVCRSELHLPPADPSFDLAAARERIERLVPGGLGSDHPALLAAACGRFAHHLNPQAELVLVSDGRSDGWLPDDRERWAALRQRLTDHDGQRQPLVTVLAPEAGPVANWGVTACTIDPEPIAAGMPATITVRISRGAGSGTASALVRLDVDGRSTAEHAVACAPEATATTTFPVTFAGPGEHTVEAVLAAPGNNLPADDRRALVVEAAARLPILLVEGRPPRPGRPFSGSLGPLAVALTTGDADNPLFAVERITAGDADLPERLEQARAVVLGDVPALDARAVAAIERATAAGAGLLVVAGPGTDPVLADRLWWRHGDGFLAAPLNRRETLRPPRHVAGAALGHAATSGLPDVIAAGWEAVRISARACPPAPGEVGTASGLERLLWSDDGRPLLMMRPLGRGRSALLACAIDGSDSDLPWRPVFVALGRALCAHLAAVVRPSRNLPIGARAAWYLPSGSTAGAGVTLDGPGTLRLPLDRSDWEGRLALVSPPLMQAGLWTLVGANAQVRFATTAPAGESVLIPVTPAVIATALAGIPHTRFASCDALARALGAGGGPVVEWWPWLVLLALTLLLAEGWWTRRTFRREQDLARSGDGPLHHGDGAGHG